MIGSREEYQRMFDVEQRLWWYQILHEKVLFQVKKHFKNNKQIKILDAACGTGGLLSFLRAHGYPFIMGFDYSEHAIEFSLERNLNVRFGDLKKVDAFRPTETYDVICCNDALYFLTDTEIIDALQSLREKLSPDGLIIINIHAFEVFSGLHDVAVGSVRRFVRADFLGYAQSAGLQVTYTTYWPFFLSVPIWMVRKWQRYQMRSGRVDTAAMQSDITYPGDFINRIFKTITDMEQVFLPTAPFGSSLFLVLKSLK